MLTLKTLHHVTLFFPMFPCDTPRFFLCFQGDQKGTLGKKGLKEIILESQIDNLTPKKMEHELSLLKSMQFDKAVNSFAFNISNFRKKSVIDK